MLVDMRRVLRAPFSRAFRVVKWIFSRRLIEGKRKN